ncbi:MAG: putative N-acetylmannosamine-6-phosphate 2-epimerase [Fervidobacterium sp.]|uniref:putative N-acetylmannosamine-6-phosphate 2-epimerase n=1 Tax=Fervidobacterium sp. TaxID=1871331 RepID=UPI00404A0B5E
MILKRISLIVSCQAYEGEELRNSDTIARVALAAKNGGASAIRTNGAEDVRAVKKATKLPVIGIYKDFECLKQGCAFITVRKEQVDEIARAGADIIAIDCSRRSRPEPISELFEYIRKNYPWIEIMADIADIIDAQEIIKYKPDYISTTLSGYTEYSKDARKPDLNLISELKKFTDIPVVAEGNYTTGQQVREAILRGAYAVVVGTAITRPRDLTYRFYSAISDLQKGFNAVGVDIGGSWIRFVNVDENLSIKSTYKVKNPQEKHRIFKIIQDYVESIQNVTHLGVASAGRIDVASGAVTFASDNIKEWTGVNIADEVERRTGLRCFVDNDVNAATYAQWWHSRENNMLLISFGTGLGAGVFVDGHLLHGAYGGASEIGHVVYPGNRQTCTCGKVGCIETLLKANKFLPTFEKGTQQEKEELLNALSWLINVAKLHYDFSTVYLHGVIKELGDNFIGILKEHYYNLYKENLEVRYSTLDEFGGAFGAALQSLISYGG